MIFAFGSTNFCHTAPKGGRKGEADLSSIKIPGFVAEMTGADPDKSYTLEEVLEMVQPFAPPGIKIDEAMIISILGLGAAVNPLEEDLTFYNKLNEDYKKYLEENGIKEDRFDPDKAQDGSFELWGYYHLGVPVFSMDLWSVPKPVEEKKEGTGLDLDQLEKMTSGEFLALGKDKIAAFMEEMKIPEQFTAERIISMVESGQTNPEQMASMIKQMANPEEKEGADPEEEALLVYSDRQLDGKGFINWEPFDHPQLGEVEIGGFAPFISTTPEISMTDSILKIRLPWVLKLATKLPSLEIYETRFTSRGAGIYQLEVWIENSSYIPFPTAMGKRNKQPAPAVVLLEGDGYTLLSGLARTPVDELGGNTRKKLTWLVRVEKETEIKVDLSSKSAGSDQTSIQIGG
jgi:hypothetical protein